MQVHAATAARNVWDAVRGRQCILWIDNWAWLRWGTDPVQTSYSQNVTALVVLVLDDIEERTVRTRSITFPPFPGYPELRVLVTHIPWAAALCCTSLGKITRTVNELNWQVLDVHTIRVPLDVRRTGIRSLGW